MEAHWRLYQLSQTRTSRAVQVERGNRALAQAGDLWPMSFALLVWVAVSELAWYGIFRTLLAVF